MNRTRGTVGKSAQLPGEGRPADALGWPPCTCPPVCMRRTARASSGSCCARKPDLTARASALSPAAPLPPPALPPLSAPPPAAGASAAASCSIATQATNSSSVLTGSGAAASACEPASTCAPLAAGGCCGGWPSPPARWGVAPAGAAVTFTSFSFSRDSSLRPPAAGHGRGRAREAGVGLSQQAEPSACGYAAMRSGGIMRCAAAQATHSMLLQKDGLLDFGTQAPHAAEIERHCGRVPWQAAPGVQSNRRHALHHRAAQGAPRLTCAAAWRASVQLVAC